MDSVRPAGDEFRDKLIVVTGAAQGIGRCVAQHFADQGARLALGDIQDEKLSLEARAMGTRDGVPWSGHLDVGDPGSVAEFFGDVRRRCGDVDILINNAGIDAPPGVAWEEPVSHWREILDVDLSGQWWCTREALRSMVEMRKGRIIFIASVAGRRGAPDISVAYSAAKAGLMGLTVSLAEQVERHGVLVNAILAGPTGNTGRPTPAELRGDLAAYPLGPGGPDPIARACLYLAGPGGDWISGAVLNVSGGTWKG